MAASELTTIAQLTSDKEKRKKKETHASDYPIAAPRHTRRPDDAHRQTLRMQMNKTRRTRRMNPNESE
jgi:hypothetical protein